MWSIDLFPDPVASPGFISSRAHHHSRLATPASSFSSSSVVVSAAVSIQTLLGNDASALLPVFQEGGRPSQEALADFASRHFLARHSRNGTEIELDDDGRDGLHGSPGTIPRQPRTTIRLETLDRALFRSGRRMGKSNWIFPPYVVERSDFWCHGGMLRVTLRGIITRHDPSAESSHADGGNVIEVSDACKRILSNVFLTDDAEFCDSLLRHAACVVLQERLRSTLSTMNAVAFIADGSILPRKSSTSGAPMASPPAVPFAAPEASPMNQSVAVDMGSFAKYLPNNQVTTTVGSAVTLNGLLIPGGVTLICGGGYHGKSTLLQTIAVGVYNKIPGDGREYCVSVREAVTVRAEDGRYVNNCNISAFISNLPTPPGVEKALDTRHFSSRDSSGSTSQAANVAEAMEMGATAILVDEDIR
jgi:Predicted ATPase of the ABC class